MHRLLIDMMLSQISLSFLTDYVYRDRVSLFAASLPQELRPQGLLNRRGRQFGDRGQVGLYRHEGTRIGCTRVVIAEPVKPPCSVCVCFSSPTLPPDSNPSCGIGTKVIGTIGPSCNDVDILSAMLNAGMVSWG